MSQRYCGRDFSDPDIAAIRRPIAEDPGRTRADLSRLACRVLHCHKADGGLEDMSARVAMLRMHADGSDGGGSASLCLCECSGDSLTARLQINCRCRRVRR